MIEAITTLTNNLGLELEVIVWLLVFLLGLIVYAKNLQIGILTHLLLFTGGFIMFFIANMNYTPFILSMFICVVLLAFSLAIKNNPTGVV